MGLDGGTVISRSDVLRGQSWDVANSDSSRSTRGGQVQAGYTHRREQVTRKVKEQVQWSTCALTGDTLREPIVACELGFLYNKESALEHMLASSGVFVSESATYAFANKEQYAEEFCHLKSSKNLQNLKLTRVQTEDGKIGEGFECPLTHLVCGTMGVGFSALRPCGHVLSDRCLEQIKGDSQCPICSTPFKKDKVIPLNGTAEQVARLREGLRARRAASSSGRKSKKSSTNQTKRLASSDDSRILLIDERTAGTVGGGSDSTAQDASLLHAAQQTATPTSGQHAAGRINRRAGEGGGEDSGGTALSSGQKRTGGDDSPTDRALRQPPPLHRQVTEANKKQRK
uniref:Replication termination factor 2 n=1 Tax=Pyramimonas obovata TaxID=1411642 RepID=A0A7S0RM64_9CHLO|mmetsp:Transcript_37897/g.82393  ORF Transcript_37897/g.82393 Transcript_37897/m.82393 type:complete len:343 (+) Transcript_37897:28-1056(+)